ncbi:hypothetical protein B0H63DRAFT_237070 [Podospora didyma]|uniref:Protein kinase domain-containing protein n=1 Tax=Podospora didyma TaxID=330526 RepID=A0AAE0KJU3_9PEZI|nr:hypothetical protein B0H63DRAFT_237070 [Podospora didyma]
MSYSNGSGGTLTLPSPTHVHRVDVSSAVRSLRRSLSRSPSKFRLSPGPASPNTDPTANYRHSPTPSSSARFEITPILATVSTTPVGPNSQTSFFTPQPSVVTPFRSNAKLSMRPARTKPATSRPLSRTRLSPKSPLKRVFGLAQDSGNPIPSSVSGPEARGQENPTFSDFALALSPSSRRNLEKPSRHSMHLDVSGSSKHGLTTRFIEANNEPFPSTSVSPLKRSDATMSLDQSNPGSPVAKRRSLHGISSLGSEFDIFNYHPPVMQKGFDIHDEANHEYQLTSTTASISAPQFREPLPSPTPSAVPKRTSSLRKSTLQQRHGDSRTSWGRRAGEKQLAQLSANETTTPGTRSRPRLSLDQYLPPDERGSPFSPQAPLPNPSIHPVGPRQANQPHPLSRTLTQSSSGSSLPDESPTHIPVHLGEKPRVPMNFSKSLPPGAPRPMNDSDPVATPEYKRAKPFQAAFHSTGLISKMNRNPELGMPQRPGAKVAMPDTPCKKQPYNSATYPPQFGSGRRGSRVSFGSPSTPFGSTPFNPPSGPIRGNPFAVQDKPNGLIFHGVRPNHARKSSLLSLDGDDQTAAVDDFPPTPTKNLFFKSFSTPAQGAQPRSTTPTLPVVTSMFGLGDDRPGSNSSCKSQTSQDAWRTGGQKGNDRPFDAVFRPSTPNPRGSPRLSLSLSSLSGHRAKQRLFATPVPPVRTTPTIYAVESTRLFGTIKTDTPTTASPLNPAEFAVTSSPQTPQDLMAPPDASRLSISNSQDEGGKSRPPATPTTHTRQVFLGFGDRRLSITPQNGHGPKDIDEALVTRFDTSEIIGEGEFSQVYRVVKSSVPTSLSSVFAATPSKRTPSTPVCEIVYAVKKIRLPAYGAKERESKLREVNILKSLTHSNKIVHYFDSWEQNSHLYIQTEYCTEGSLDGFLRTAGRDGRLDDFRIWKILFEISQGLAAVHDAGFIHLDIKPANIFVNFDGYLKIGDFGMAAQWPAARGIDGEGDREYIAPEILLGQFDKPADIFALGLIVLEIACNVFLPDNGPLWQGLRNGDLSAVPSLTCGEAGAIVRDANGVPIELDSAGTPNVHESASKVGFATSGKRRGFPFEAMTHDPSNLFGGHKRSELLDPPTFMTDPKDANSLDNIVAQMIKPNPADRPTAQQLLMLDPVIWVLNRRRAGASVYEGNWGPQNGPSVAEIVDTEMTDV